MTYLISVFLVSTKLETLSYADIVSSFVIQKNRKPAKKISLDFP